MRGKEQPYKGIFCSHECFIKYRWGRSSIGKCKFCGEKTETIFCSKKCRDNWWNKNTWTTYRKKKFWNEKIKLLKELGGKCIKCGINDIRVLDINHVDRGKKFKVKNRNYAFQTKLRDWKKNKGNLKIMCSNCHRIHTWEQLDYWRDMEIEK